MVSDTQPILWQHPEAPEESDTLCPASHHSPAELMGGKDSVPLQCLSSASFDPIPEKGRMGTVGGQPKAHSPPA